MLRQRIAELIEQHGSLRAAARVLMVDPGYLSRLASGEKDDPGEDLLRRMKLRRVVAYERTASTGADTARQGQDDHAGSPAHGARLVTEQSPTNKAFWEGVQWAQAGAQQQDDHAGSPAPSPVAVRYRDASGRWRYLNFPFTKGWAFPMSLGTPEPLYAKPTPSAQSSKAALSDEEIGKLRAQYQSGEIGSFTGLCRAVLARAGITPQAGKESGDAQPVDRVCRHGTAPDVQCLLCATAIKESSDEQ